MLANTKKYVVIGRDRDSGSEDTMAEKKAELEGASEDMMKTAESDI